MRQKIETIGQKDIPLAPGWNLISFNVTPKDSTIDQIINSLPEGTITNIMGYINGLKTWDYSRPDYANDLDALTPLYGYWMRNSPNEQVNLIINGTEVLPDNPINLLAGWNLLSYLPTESDVISHALASLGTKYSYLMGYEGRVKTWDRNRPDFVNDLLVLKPGNGY